MRGRAGLEKREGKEKNPLEFAVSSTTGNSHWLLPCQTVITERCSRWFPPAIIINMAASCTNADVLATVIQNLGGLTLKDGQNLALNSLLRGKDVFTCFDDKEQRCSVLHFELSLTSFPLVLIQVLLNEVREPSLRDPFLFRNLKYFFRSDVSCFLLAKVSKRNPKCALTGATEIRLTDIFLLVSFLSCLQLSSEYPHSFRFATISKSPATTYQIRPLSLLARKTILMLLRCEGGVLLMS